MRVSGLLNVTRWIMFAVILCNAAMTITITPNEALAGVQKARRNSTRKSTGKPIKITREVVREAQQRLAELGYWIGSADGKWGEASRHGLIAFQKVEHRTRTGRLSAEDVRALRNASRPEPRERSGAHVEVDLTRQVLMMVSDDGKVSRILPVSTGNGKQFDLEGETVTAITPTGRFRVYRKLTGWRVSPLGELYYPNYIIGGIAIHGNKAVPAVPASHGCIRIPMYAAVEFSTLTPVGTPVIVYSGAGP